MIPSRLSKESAVGMIVLKQRTRRLVALGLLCLGLSSAGGIEPGATAPDFQLVSGDGRELGAEQIKGKVGVVFYETRDTVEQNRAFKKELGQFLDRAPVARAQVMVLAVINCSLAAWPVTAIWRAKLRENSEKEGLTIYGDWDGKMAAAYAMKADCSNIVIIDTRGMVRYRFAGPMGDEEIRSLLALVERLAAEHAI